MIDEPALVQRSRTGDHEAFRTLYEAHVDPLYRFLRQFSNDHHEVEEWVQRAFIKAYERLDSFREDSRFSTWIFSIGLNEMRSDRRRATILQFEPQESDDRLPAEDSSEGFHWNDMMRGWLSQLAELKRAVFLLYEVEGYNHSEIALMLGIQESTSRTILTRTKQWLREQWEKERREVG
ncbi:MAG TPA: sigma-70 family RNA polymerase sigma factor [Bacteroidota bacterium]|nr:sigma-70 family RNA polymerase sigma factor [Bacteroidota bacterium]